MVPLSVLGQVRRSLIKQLMESLEHTVDRAIVRESVLPEIRPVLGTVRHLPVGMHVLCRSLKQLEFVLETECDEISVDFSDIRQYRDAVSLARGGNVRLALATPRIFKPGETGILSLMLRHEPEAVLARNLAAIVFFRRQGIPVIADYSLNVANELSADVIKRIGAERITVSYDLNREQLLGLMAAAPPDWLEVVVHQHMPMFHMEHCVFCSVLSPGTNKSNCGRPCDDHVVHLEDRVGMRHVLTADVGCRNTLFNAQAQSAAEIVPELMLRGIRCLRIEMLDHESKSVVRQTIGLYRQLLRGQITGKQVWRELQASNRVGVTRGTLEEKRDPLAIL